MNLDFSSYHSFLLDTLVRLLGTDSPSGYTARAIALAETIAQQCGFQTTRTNKGNLIVSLPGRQDGPSVGVCSHVDTLGLMVRSIQQDGQLRFTRVGGPLLPTLDGAYCTLYTRENKQYTGTVLSLSPAAHVFSDAATRARDEENMAVRLDEIVSCKADVQALGIQTGDYLCIDPKIVVTDSGFVKSRFLDDKASCACLLTLLRLLSDENARPVHPVDLLFTVHEEVVHGGAAFGDYAELLVVDMGCVGSDLSCTEQQVSICAKDSSGPYDYEMTSRLIALAKAHNIPYAVDIYPYYSSDGSVALKAGCDARCALIGPGVHASHGMERTHIQGLSATLQLLWFYLDCQ